jgi:hypothetical protein
MARCHRPKEEEEDAKLQGYNFLPFLEEDFEWKQLLILKAGSHESVRGLLERSYLLWIQYLCICVYVYVYVFL